MTVTLLDDAREDVVEDLELHTDEDSHDSHSLLGAPIEKVRYASIMISQLLDVEFDGQD